MNIRLTNRMVSGTIKSPHFPYWYMNNLDCQWLIRAKDKRHGIKLTIDWMSTQDRSVLWYKILIEIKNIFPTRFELIFTFIFDSMDRLYIYDGPNANSSTISGSGSFLSGQVAGLNNYPNVVLTSRNQHVFLQFITDEKDTHPGFRIHYEQGKYFNLPYKFRMMHF